MYSRILSSSVIVSEGSAGVNRAVAILSVAYVAICRNRSHGTSRRASEFFRGRFSIRTPSATATGCREGGHHLREILTGASAHCHDGVERQHLLENSIRRIGNCHAVSDEASSQNSLGRYRQCHAVL
ncbi:unnamed protein product [Trichogramma brassicae]|uniref:Uncharacterized protein n=1 Tax=Trichogramma brassicae TaxID=86971 RepID=A0A6H5HYT1_9HYME|nr:unnamed protein product [Trichogramma brassicae]